MNLLNTDCSSLTGFTTYSYGTVNNGTPEVVTKDSRSAWHVFAGNGTGYNGCDIRKSSLGLIGTNVIIATFRADVHQTVVGSKTTDNYTGEPYIDQVYSNSGTVGLGLAINWMDDGVYAFSGMDATGSFVKISDTTSGTGQWETWKIVEDWTVPKFDLYRSLNGGTTFTTIGTGFTAFKTEPSPDPDRIDFGCDSMGTYSAEVWFDSARVDTQTRVPESFGIKVSKQGYDFKNYYGDDLELILNTNTNSLKVYAVGTGEGTVVHNFNLIPPFLSYLDNALGDEIRLNLDSAYSGTGTFNNPAPAGGNDLYYFVFYNG